MPRRARVRGTVVGAAAAAVTVIPGVRNCTTVICHAICGEHCNRANGSGVGLLWHKGFLAASWGPPLACCRSQLAWATGRGQPAPEYVPSCPGVASPTVGNGRPRRPSKPAASTGTRRRFVPKGQGSGQGGQGCYQRRNSRVFGTTTL